MELILHQDIWHCWLRAIWSLTINEQAWCGSTIHTMPYNNRHGMNIFSFNYLPNPLHPISSHLTHCFPYPSIRTLLVHAGTITTRSGCTCSDPSAPGPVPASVAMVAQARYSQLPRPTLSRCPRCSTVQAAIAADVVGTAAGNIAGLAAFATAVVAAAALVEVGTPVVRMPTVGHSPADSAVEPRSVSRIVSDQRVDRLVVPRWPTARTDLRRNRLRGRFRPLRCLFGLVLCGYGDALRFLSVVLFLGSLWKRVSTVILNCVWVVW